MSNIRNREHGKKYLESVDVLDGLDQVVHAFLDAFPAGADEVWEIIFFFVNSPPPGFVSAVLEGNLLRVKARQRAGAGEEVVKGRTRGRGRGRATESSGETLLKINFKQFRFKFMSIFEFLSPTFKYLFKS